MDDCERYDGILKSLKDFITIEDKLAIYKEMEEILVHNRNQIEINTTKNISYAFSEFYNHYNNVFNKVELL